MLTRRGFVSCAICAVAGFAATDAGAQSPGLKRTIVSRTDGPAAGYETIEARVEIDAGGVVARHTHFGIESTYVLDGAIDLDVQGVGSKTFSAGQGFQVPPLVPHGGKIGDKPVTLIVNYIVEKGKPLVTPA